MTNPVRWLFSTNFQFFFSAISGVMGTCFSVLIRREFSEIYFFSTFYFVLLTLVLLAGIFLYRWLSWRRRKMRSQWMLILVHIMLFLFTIIMLNLGRYYLFSSFISGGLIASTWMIMHPAGDAHEPATSWDGSWIGRWLHQNEGGHEASSQPSGTGVTEQEQAGPSQRAPQRPSSAELERGQPDQGPAAPQANAAEPAGQAEPHPPFPTRDEVKSQLGEFLNSFRKIKAPLTFVNRTSDELGIDTASPAKLAAIHRLMGRISEDLPKKAYASGQNAAAALLKQVDEWEKGV